MIVQICVGSSCHLKGSEKIVGLFGKAIEEHKLENEITLAGSFCTGKCNRVGVTVSVDDEVYTGVTPENFTQFFEDKVLKVFNAEKE
jgi:NADH:ubiquinone oxidoreductase subunit E